MAVIAIDYAEGKYKTYRGVTVDMDDGGHHFFATGDPVVDFAAAVKKSREEDGDLVMLSSSCDQFGFDHPGLEWTEDSELGEILAWKDGYGGNQSDN